MDSITQAALGGLCGELILGRQLGWKGAAWGLLIGTLPDLDIICSLWQSQLEWMHTHRGLSHSILLAIGITPLLGWLLTKIHRQLSLARASTFIFAAWSTHVLIDCFNSYGTQIYEPFSDHRVTLNNIAIIDLFFTLPMLLGLMVCLFFNRVSSTRRCIAIGISGWLCFYVTASFGMKALAHAHFKHTLTAEGIHAQEIITSPTISNIFLWRMLARDDSQYYVAYWSVFDGDSRPIAIDRIPQHPELVIPYQASAEFELLDWFSEGWWKAFTVPSDPESIYFCDMRFGEMHASIDGTPAKIPSFLWKISHDAHGNVTVVRASLRDQADVKSALAALYQRMKGGAPDWMHAPWLWELD